MSLVDVEEVYESLDKVQEEFGDSMKDIFSNADLEDLLLNYLDGNEVPGDYGLALVFGVANYYDVDPVELGLPPCDYRTDGEKIREDRGELTKKEYSENIGVVPGTIYSLENNKAAPTTRTVDKLLKNTDLTEEDLGIAPLLREYYDLEGRNKQILTAEFLSMSKKEKKGGVYAKRTANDLRKLAPSWKNLYEVGVGPKITKRNERWILKSRPLPVVDKLLESVRDRENERNVPEYLDFSDEVLSIFYRNHGLLARRPERLPAMRLLARRFNSESLDRIHSSLRERGLSTGESKAEKDNGYVLRIDSSSVYRAFELIGECPVEIRNARVRKRNMKDNWPTEEEMDVFKDIRQDPNSVEDWDKAKYLRSDRALREELGEDYEELEELQSREGLKDILRNARTDKGLEVDEMSNAIGRKAPTLHNYENGTTMPSTGTLYRYLLELGLGIEELQERLEED